MDFLSGKKTYIGIVLGTLWALLGIFGLVDPSSEQYQAVAALIVAFTGYGVNVAIHKRT